MIRQYILACFFFGSFMEAQNTAVTTGNWNSCITWGSPGIVYRNTADTKTINNAVTVTANETWSTGAIQLVGSGAVNMNGGIIVDFTNDQGADMNCDAVYSALQAAGCASCGSYLAAADNQYVKITEAEYASIRAMVSGIVIAGAQDVQLNSNTGASTGTAMTTSIATSHQKAPANSYAVAFAIPIYGFGSGNAIVKLKYNTTGSPTTGYADYGYGNYGVYPKNVSGKHFFLIKHPSQTTYNGGNSFMAFYLDSPGIRLEGNEAGYGAYMSDSNTLGTGFPFNYRPCFQILTTTLRQW